jgi:hypothetical protein
VAIAAQLLMLIYFTVDNHIDLYPWNNLRSPRAELPSTLAGWIPFSLIIAGVTLRMRRGMLIGTVYAYVWLLLQIRQWWIPYLLGRTRLHDEQPSHTQASDTKADGITPWPPRHAQSGIRFHIYALTSVNFDSVLEPHCRQPPSIAVRSAVASRIICARTKTGQSSVRKLDAHQGVPAEMAYFLCRLPTPLQHRTRNKQRPKAISGSVTGRAC